MVFYLYTMKNEYLNIHLGIMLRDARATKGWSQSKLASKMGSTQSTISRLENGNGLPTMEIVRKIADAYDTKLILPKFQFIEDDE